jgi:hypothetical protein
MKTTAFFSLAAITVDSLATLEHWLRVICLVTPIVVGLVQAIKCWMEPPSPPAPPVAKTALRLMLLVGFLGFMPGCATSQLPAVISSLAGDTNRVDVIVVTPWGHAEFRRNAPSLSQ